MASIGGMMLASCGSLETGSHWTDSIAAFDDVLIEDLLHMSEGYGVIKVPVLKQSSWVGSMTADVAVGHDGLMLGVERGGNWISSGFEDLKLEVGNKFVLYDPASALQFSRKLADADSAKAAT